MSDTTVAVTHEVEQHRFSIALDGEVVGFAVAHDRGRARIFPHTEVAPEHGGKGVASRLVREALDATVDAGMTIVPVCPYVANWIRTHEGYADHVDARFGDLHG